MIGRRAFYLARLAQSNKVMPGLQLDRTRLAQAASERRPLPIARSGKSRSAAPSNCSSNLRMSRPIASAQSAEVERLRQQIDENRRAAEARVEADRQARIAAERQLDEA